MNNLVSILALGFVLGAGLTANAQQLSKYNQKGFASLSVGNGIAGGAGLPLTDTFSRQENTNKTPVFQLGVDYMVTERFSVGALAAYQNINSRVNDSLGIFLEEASINRLYFGVRGLWHYGRNERIDLYSGFKIGMVNFSTNDITQADPNTISILEDHNNRTRYSLGIIPIGMRFLITDKIGGHLQVSIGAPTFFSLGANYAL